MLLSPLPQLLEPVHNLSEILFIYSHILATVSLFSRPGQNCYIPLCYLSFQQVKKDPEQALTGVACTLVLGAIVGRAVDDKDISVPLEGPLKEVLKNGVSKEQLKV